MDSDRDLRTPEQKYADGKKDRMFVPKSLVKSEAFAALSRLRTGIPMRVLLIFLTKRHMERRRRPGTRDQYWEILNNGEITFSYIEAKDKYGIADGPFRNAIDALVRLGFLDVAYVGSGVKGDLSRYAISDRWRQYPTSAFKTARRPKRTRGPGFKRGNDLGQFS
jgi:hypothetical protein